MIQLAIKDILSTNFILPFLNNQRFIFIYHDISNESAKQHSQYYSTTIKNFKEQVSFLSSLFEWVDLNEISRKEPFKNNVASLVFDDGFKTVETNALPLLKEKNIPLSIFVNKCAIKYNRLWISDLEFNQDEFDIEFKPAMHTNYSSNKYNYKSFENDSAFNNKLNSLSLSNYENEQIYLNAKDILSLHKDGVIFGNHGSFHVNLAMCNKQNLYSEIVDNKLFIENILNKKIIHYAFSFGKKQHYSQNIIDIIKASGHEYIYSSNPIRLSNSSKNKTIPRIGLRNESQNEILFYINRQYLKKINL